MQASEHRCPACPPTLVAGRKSECEWAAITLKAYL